MSPVRKSGSQRASNNSRATATCPKPTAPCNGALPKMSTGLSGDARATSSSRTTGAYPRRAACNNADNPCRSQVSGFAPMASSALEIKMDPCSAATDKADCPSRVSGASKPCCWTQASTRARSPAAMAARTSEASVSNPAAPSASSSLKISSIRRGATELPIDTVASAATKAAASTADMPCPSPDGRCNNGPHPGIGTARKSHWGPPERLVLSMSAWGTTLGAGLLGMAVGIADAAANATGEPAELHH
mmetsp:Transcript_81920/g.236891  ORF Transcript_81920/g.236891 Transcript_81920/m.236891 type:complete len:248 (-) Transcript_81920:71-814(-)